MMTLVAPVSAVAFMFIMAHLFFMFTMILMSGVFAMSPVPAVFLMVFMHMAVRSHDLPFRFMILSGAI